MKAAQDQVLRSAINQLNFDKTPAPHQLAKAKLIEALAQLQKFGYDAVLVESVIKIVHRLSNEQCRRIINRWLEDQVRQETEPWFDR